MRLLISPEIISGVQWLSGQCAALWVFPVESFPPQPQQYKFHFLHQLGLAGNHSLSLNFIFAVYVWYLFHWRTTQHLFLMRGGLPELSHQMLEREVERKERRRRLLNVFLRSINWGAKEKILVWDGCSHAQETTLLWICKTMQYARFSSQSLFSTKYVSMICFAVAHREDTGWMGQSTGLHHYSNTSANPKPVSCLRPLYMTVAVSIQRPYLSTTLTMCFELQKHTVAIKWKITVLKEAFKVCKYAAEKHLI